MTLSRYNMKPYTNEKGNTVLTLPVAGADVEFRSPKGKDLKTIELASRADNATNVDIMFTMIATLAVEPKLTVAELEEMDAEDVAAMGAALSSFRAFRSLGAQ